MTAEIAGQAMTIAFLRQLPAGSGPAGAVHGERATASPQIASPPPGPIAPDAPRAETAVQSLPFSLPAAAAVNFRETRGMALLLRPGSIVELWDERWEELTGLTRHDLAGVSSELFLDWLFPRQHDRNFVADLFHQSERRGAQALLEVVGRTGNLSLLCAFLPVRASELREEASASGDWTKGPVRDARSRLTDAWLILACEPEVTPTEEGRVQPFAPVQETSAMARYSECNPEQKRAQ